MSIDRDAATPIHKQLAALFREKIRSGELAPGARLPSTTRLQQEYEVSEVTAKNAMELLKQEGLVEGVSGRGRFVARSPVPPSAG